MRPLHIFFALLVAVVWGGNFVASKLGMEHFPPFLFTALRFAGAAALLIPFVPKPSRAQIPRLLELALALGVLHFALVIGGLYYGLDIASCAIAAQMGVPFSCILSALLLKDRLGRRRIGGMAIAFGGMALVVGAPQVSGQWLAFSVALLGAFFWGVSNILIKRLGDMPGLQVLGWMALFALPQLLLVSWAVESAEWKPLLDAPLRSLAAVAYTAVNSTIVAYGLWYYLLKKYPVSQVAPFSLLVPVFSILSGQWFFDEPLTWQTMAGGAIVIAGVAIIVARRPKLMQLGEPV